MHIREILEREKTAFSFEFFPPKTPKASTRLFETISRLMPLRPSYVSVTYGAGGSTRNLTEELLVRLKKETDLSIVAHLTCVGATRDETRRILERYDEIGIENIMALRGDFPEGMDNYEPPQDGFAYATDLVAFIKKHFPHMGIGVAGYVEGHPETPNRLKEIEYMKAKADAGADYVCTQLFFDNRDFYDYCERCELAGIDIPILAGIMPIGSRSGMMRMADLAAGSRFPARLARALSRAETDEGFERVGMHWATEQVLDLLHHDVKGIHFYTLNRSKATLRICESLGLESSQQLRVGHS